MKALGVYGSLTFFNCVDSSVSMSKSNLAALDGKVGLLSHHPLPEPTDRPLMDVYLEKSHHYMQQHEDHEDDPESRSSSRASSTTPVPGESQCVSHRWSDSTLTGSFFSGRCSTYSWGAEEADFEKETAEKVRKKFSKIHAALYEGKSTGTVQIDQECKQWSTNFPHLVVQGIHLLDSLDDGTDMVDPDPFLMLNTPTVDLDTSAVSQELEVLGKSLQPRSLEDLQCHNHLCEEVIASDGIIEEYFAFDNSEEESIDTHRRSRLKRYRGLPPLTPNAAVKDTVCHLVFDQIWNETVAVLQPLVALIRERASQGRHSSNYSLGERPLPPLAPPQDDELSQQQPYILRGLRDPPTLTKASGPSGSKFLRFKHSSTNLPSTLPQLTDNLSGVMQIRSVALQHRIPSISIVNDTSREGTPTYFGRPESCVTGSRFLKMTTPLPARMSDFQLPATPGNRLISSRMASRRNVTLKPIERSKTPALEPIDSGIRGYKLYATPSHSSPPSTPLVRNNQLPPLETTFSSKGSFGAVNSFEKSPPFQVRTSAREKNRVTFNSRIISGTDSQDSWKYPKTSGIGNSELRPSTTTNSFRHTQDSSSKSSIGRKTSDHAMHYYGRMKVVGHAAGHHGGGVLETALSREKMANSIAEDDEILEDDSLSFAVHGTSGFFQSKPRSISGRTKMRGQVR